MQHQERVEEPPFKWMGLLHSERSSITIFIFSVIFIGGGLVLLYQKESGAVRDIRVEGNRYLTEGEILSLSGVSSGLYVNEEVLEAIRERLEKNRHIKRAGLEFDDGVLKISIEDSLCAFIASSGSSLYDVDEELNILSSDSIRCVESPIVKGSLGIQNGKISDPRMIEVGGSLARIRRTMPELHTRISEIVLKGQKRATLFISSAKIRIELLGDLSESNVKRLYAALSYFEKEGHGSGLIDLRGPDAVLVPDL